MHEVPPLQKAKSEVIHKIPSIYSLWLQIHLLKKVKQNNVWIISKQFSHPDAMTLTFVKLQKNRHKTVGKDIYTRYLVSIHFSCKKVYL